MALNSVRRACALLWCDESFGIADAVAPLAGSGLTEARRTAITPRFSPHTHKEKSDLWTVFFRGSNPHGLHLGNYLGAMQNWVRLQDSYECIYCVVDLHAITMWQDPAELRTNTREVTAAIIAAGIDPKKNIIFNQSRNSDHTELTWVFNCVARLGWLNRMTQFKEKAGKNRENASIGLYDYPVLMAADILAYKATHVPVGDDQKQHLELARDIAQKFNNDFGVDLFPLPEPIILGVASRVMSLRNGTQKMSKSDPSEYSRINLNDGPDDIALKIRKQKPTRNRCQVRWQAWRVGRRRRISLVFMPRSATGSLRK